MKVLVRICEEAPCRKCDGKGFTAVLPGPHIYYENQRERCSVCDGDGEVERPVMYWADVEEGAIDLDSKVHASRFEQLIHE